MPVQFLFLASVIFGVNGMIDERTLRAPKAIIYGTNSCPHCTMAKRYLSEKGVECTEYDVSKDPRRAAEMFAMTGQSGVPVIVINNMVIVGFARPAIDAALADSMIF